MRSVFVLILLALQIYLTVDAKRVFRLPLKHFEGSFKTALRQGKVREFADKLNHASVSSNRARRIGTRRDDNTYSQSVYTFKDTEYIGYVTVGTPEQSFAVAVDTGSSNFWIPDSSCSTKSKCNKICDKPDNCKAYCDEYCCGEVAEESELSSSSYESCEDGEDNRVHSDASYYQDDLTDTYYYDGGRRPRNRCNDEPSTKKKQPLQATCEQKRQFYANESSTYKRYGTSFFVQYGTGFVEGFVAADTFKFGDYGDDRLTVPALRFGLATTMAKYFRQTHIDGILGLGSEMLARGNTVPPFIRAVQLRLAEPIFTAYLTHGTNPNGGSGGVITYGGVDDVNCDMSRVGYTSQTSDVFYQFLFSKVCVGNVCKSGGSAVSDTGTSLILGPPKIIDTIATAVGATQAEDSDYYTVDCKAEYDPVQFKIAYHDYNLTRDVLSIDVGLKNGRCLFGMAGADIGPYYTWMFGDPFIRAYCNIYDFGTGKWRIGFAPAKP